METMIHPGDPDDADGVLLDAELWEAPRAFDLHEGRWTLGVDGLRPRCPGASGEADQ